MRACPDCGEVEHRIVKDGRELLNLDPVSGRCLACLTKIAKATVRAMPSMPKDWQKAAAGDEEP